MIRRAIRAKAPQVAARTGLKDVAELCGRRAASRTGVAGADWHAVRDHILTIGCEWDLAADDLEQQSDVCLHWIARFLG
jgi:hypothetical protein